MSFGDIMKNKNSQKLEQTQKYPEWYWPSGLHDACIYEIECYEYPEVYYKCKGKNRDNIYNLLVLKIDSVGAIYDQTVKEIRFYNYKCLQSDFDFKNLIAHKCVRWIGDILTEEDECYRLDIDLYDTDVESEYFNIKISFEMAETDRIIQ